ncbi:TIGR04452 family lipoprotein [Leptospira sp. 201903070]|uniref:TIGR04452 family lipoprotein n=1 Tax=Leptospira ainlahdjerensis TaxID=2810033 RepID=A0ABS2UBG8_9LEPT|nr:TIGR04452 family lipoprotein [Leptospira ainlahdjerensis]MBM9577709.1 TIGR04452 family lipoprotein [Leptospira ainlahdjerensis]MBM9577711.1 TIGR04452 family lipoprotein [Leptospira ainlahdjerensis]
MLFGKIKANSLFLLFAVFLCKDCAYLDINPSLVTGKEAKEIISDRLLLSQLVYIMGLSEAEPVRSASLAGLTLTLVIPDSMGIDEKKVYQKDAVDECADRIFLISIVSTALSTFVCDASNPPISIPVISKKL